MKRKRPLEGENPQEAVKIKRQKSQVKFSENDGDIIDNDSHKSKDLPLPLSPKNLRKKNTKTSVAKGLADTTSEADFPIISGASTSEKPTNNRKRKTRGDVNQNGSTYRVIKENEIAPNTLKKQNRNGVPLRASSDSPSDFQPLGNYLKKTKVARKTALQEDIIASEENPKSANSKKTKHDKKLVSVNTQGCEQSMAQSKLELCSNESGKNRSNPILRHGSSKISKKKLEATENGTDVDTEFVTTNVCSRKAKKKVRIDETESLKVKKEMAEAETHFSAKELPAKIIKSKLNKNLTEEVKVSPLTVQDVKKEKKIFRKSKLGNKLMDEGKSTLHSDQIKLEEELYQGTGFPMELELGTTSEESDLEVYYINKNAEKEARRKSINKKQTIKMPKEDQLILVERIQNYIPEGDTKSYKYRLRNLEWTKIAFKNYTLEECQTVWTQLLKKVRHYRLLAEITHDVKRVIELVDLEEVRPRRSKSSSLHPDMPKRPLTSYFLYYIRKRDKLVKERPDLDTAELNRFISEKYQNLSMEKKQKYEVLAAKNREEYKKQLEEFYSKHPEMRKVVIKRQRKSEKEKPPKRPENPYRLFIQAEQNREEILEEDKAEFKEVCREKWNQMSDEKKLVWINLAEERHMQYEKELKDYMARHPEYTPKSQNRKPVLSRQEVMLKDKLAGKPKKPPGAAYGLFISMTLQSSEIADIPPKERWNYTSTKWKAMTDDQREQYKTLLTQVHEQYQKDFKMYLDSLPEDKRQEEILKNLPKKRRGPATDKASTSGSKGKSTATKSTSARTKTAKQKGSPVQNPVPPARSAYKFFAEKYAGDNAKEAWKNLTSAEKENYERQLSVIKDKYIKDFEAYLKSLTKDELAAFCANRGSQEEYSSSEESESESEHGEEESSEDSIVISDSENESDEN